jgi:hypothetical protein
LNNLYLQCASLGKWYDNNFQTDSDYLSFFLKATEADCVSLCATRYCLGAKTLETMARHTFSDNSKKLLLCGANSVFENSGIIFKCFEYGFNVLPTWFTSSGNSLLFANLLSTPQTRTPFEILRHIADHLINVLIDVQEKYDPNPYIALFKRHNDIKAKHMVI